MTLIFSIHRECKPGEIINDTFTTFPYTVHPAQAFRIVREVGYEDWVRSVRESLGEEFAKDCLRRVGVRYYEVLTD